MKIRWTSSSVRLRITPSEFAALQGGRSIQEALPLPGGACWQVEVVTGAAETALSCDGGALRVALSEADGRLLAEPEREGVYFQQPQPGGVALRYFIEKDFPCAHPRASDALEPHSETFVPPPGFEERKNAPLGRAAPALLRLPAPASPPSC